MTWQEELSKLDEDFSAGKLTADDYRVRREQVLQSAVTPTQQPEQGGGNSGGSTADSTQIISASSLPQGPPRYGQQPPQGQAPSAQQSPQSPGANPERTQVVPHWQPPQQGPVSPAGGFPQQPPASPPGGFPQQHHGPPSGGFGQHPPQPPAGGFGQPQQSGWEVPAEEPSPPWGGDEFPPVAPSSESDWGLTQGPEDFATSSKKSSKTSKIVGVALTAIVLLALSFGAWWIWGKDSNPGGAQAQPPATAPTTDVPPEEIDNLPVAALPGNAKPYDHIETFGDVEDLNYLTAAEVDVYEDANAGEARFHIQELPDGSVAIFLLTEVGNPAAAEDSPDELQDIQIGNGASKADDAPTGIRVTEYTHPEQDHGQIRAHYVSGNVLVRIEVRNEDGLDEARADFETVLEAQLEVMPADV